MAFVVDWAKDKAAGYLKTGIQASGAVAGNAVGGVGSLVENSGRSLAEGRVKNSIGGVGNYMNNYGNRIKGSMAADGPVNAPEKTATVTKPRSAASAPPSSRAKRTPTTTRAPQNAATTTPAPKKGPASTGVSSGLQAASKPRTSTSEGAIARGKAATRSKPAINPIRCVTSAQHPKTRSDKTPKPKPSPPASAKTPSAKVKISPESRPRSVKAA